MNNKNMIKSFCGVVLLTVVTTSFAADIDNNTATEIANKRFAVGINIGTAGAGLEARIAITEGLYGRIGANYFTYKQTSKNNISHNLAPNGFNVSDALNLKITATSFITPLMLDYHPITNSGFRLSAGVAYNGNKIEAKARPTQAVSLYGHTYTAAQLGEVKAALTIGNKIAPIISVGYDTSCMNSSRFSFNAEAGVMYAGKPKLKVSATGLAGSDPQAIADINRDANKALNSIKNYLKFMPIVSIGFKYNF